MNNEDAINKLFDHIWERVELYDTMEDRTAEALENRIRKALTKAYEKGEIAERKRWHTPLTRGEKAEYNSGYAKGAEDEHKKNIALNMQTGQEAYAKGQADLIENEEVVQAVAEYIQNEMGYIQDEAEDASQCAKNPEEADRREWKVYLKRARELLFEIKKASESASVLGFGKELPKSCEGEALNTLGAPEKPITKSDVKREFDKVMKNNKELIEELKKEGRK